MADGFTWRAAGADAERMLVIGSTGSGKTTKARELVAAAHAGGADVVWFDVKGMNDPGYPIVPAKAILTPDGLTTILAEHGRAITVQADPFGEDSEELNHVAMMIFLRGNMLFVLDDAMGIQASKPSKFVDRIITQGRARGVGFMSVVQRAHWIPQVFLSEAEHIIAFELHGEADIDRLVAVGSEELAKARGLARWEYLWYSRRDRQTIACQPMTLASPSETPQPPIGGEVPRETPDV